MDSNDRRRRSASVCLCQSVIISLAQDLGSSRHPEQAKEDSGEAMKRYRREIGQKDGSVPQLSQRHTCE